MFDVGNTTKLKLPSWLDPWWHIDYEIFTAVPPEVARTMLTQRPGRLRSRSTPDGGLVLVRRGGFLNEFVRARVRLDPNGSGTTVSLRIARPRATSAFFAFMLPFLFLGSLLQVIGVVMRDGVTAAAGWLPFLLIGPAIWAAVIGANYTSARSEANDLRRLINEALAR